VINASTIPRKAGDLGSLHQQASFRKIGVVIEYQPFDWSEA
jgi:hypothetical protein